MSALHLICAPTAVPSCLKAAAPDDALLLVGDGAFASIKKRVVTAKLPVMVLAEDAEARGVTPAATVTPVTYDDFVMLVVQHDLSITWT